MQSENKNIPKNMLLIDYYNGFLNDVFDTVYEYGWYFLALGLGLAYVYYTYLDPWIQERIKKNEEARYAAEIHKNPDAYRAKQLGMDAARQKMQEEYAKQNEQYRKKQEELEEQRNIERLDRVAHVSTGEKLGKSDDSKKSFKAEYNPLMGAGTSGGYRPPKKGCCGKKCG